MGARIYSNPTDTSIFDFNRADSCCSKPSIDFDVLKRIGFPGFGNSMPARTTHVTFVKLISYSYLLGITLQFASIYAHALATQMQRKPRISPLLSPPALVTAAMMNEIETEIPTRNC